MAGQTVSFSKDILPLFTQRDIEHMSEMSVELNNYDYMKVPANAQNVSEQVSAGNMPPKPEGPWPKAKIELFRQWIAGGYEP